MKWTRLVHSASCAWLGRRMELLDESHNLLGAHDFAAVNWTEVIPLLAEILDLGCHPLPEYHEG
jgi:hypothetical protein